MNDNMEDDLQQPPSNESIIYTLRILCSFLRINRLTTDSIYNGTKNIVDFFGNQISISSGQSEITEYFKEK